MVMHRSDSELDKLNHEVSTSWGRRHGRRAWFLAVPPPDTLRECLAAECPGAKPAECPVSHLRNCEVSGFAPAKCAKCEMSSFALRNMRNAKCPISHLRNSKSLESHLLISQNCISHYAILSIGHEHAGQRKSRIVQLLERRCRRSERGLFGETLVWYGVRTRRSCSYHQ